LTKPVFPKCGSRAKNICPVCGFDRKPNEEIDTEWE